MERRTLLAVALSIAIIMGWQKYFVEPRMPKPQVTSAVQTGTTAGEATPSAPAKTTGGTSIEVPATPKHPSQLKVASVQSGEASFGDGNAIIADWKLKSYRLHPGADSSPVDLKSVTHQDLAASLSFDDPDFAYLNSVQGAFEAAPSGLRWKYEDSKIKLVREYVTSEAHPFVDVKITAEFKQKKPGFAFLSLVSNSFQKDPEEQDRQLVYFTDHSIERTHLKDSIERKEIGTPVKFVAATSRYFLMAIVAQGGDPRGLIQQVATPQGEAIPKTGRINLVYPVSGNTLTIPTRIFFGPKSLDVLRSVDPSLDTTVDFGWFTIFAYPILKFLRLLYTVFGNYGVAIIVLTLLLKLATYPLTYKSVKSMKEMARLQPQLARLKEKYKDDREALNREMLSLMRTHGYNPMAGCLPILIQMPIFFALYRVLYSSIELFQAPFMLWIHDLSLPDPFYVTPVLMTGAMYLQQRLTPNTATDPAQARMMQMMPLMFGVFMLWLPSGLTLYMLVNALSSIVQQSILNKKFDVGPHVQPVAARAR